MESRGIARIRDHRDRSKAIHPAGARPGAKTTDTDIPKGNDGVVVKLAYDMAYSSEIIKGRVVPRDMDNPNVFYPFLK